MPAAAWYQTLRINNGIVTAPAYAFLGSASTGLFYTSGTTRLAVAMLGVECFGWDGAGHYVPAVDATFDIGSAARAIRNLYIAGRIVNKDYTQSFMLMGY